MKKYGLIILFLLLAGCTERKITNVDVKMYNSSGDSLGVINLSEQGSGIKMKLKLEGLTPGIHAIHIHEKGQCKAPDFKSAGNHLNPENKEHGLLHPKGAHLGDLPNLIVGDDGTTKAELTLPNATLSEGKDSLFTKNGTTIVVTARKDDGMTQPSGNSGNRVACGEISKDKE